MTPTTTTEPKPRDQEKATELTLTEAMAKMRELLAKMPQGEWERSEMEEDGPPKDMDAVVESVGNCYRAAPDSLVINGVYIPEGDGVWACHTGNGPTSAAMAEFIAHARNWMPLFLDHIENTTRGAVPVGNGRKA